jgi:hypothetical protein
MPISILRVVPSLHYDDTLELQYKLSANHPLRTFMLSRTEALALAASLDRALVKQALQNKTATVAE